MPAKPTVIKTGRGAIYVGRPIKAMNIAILTPWNQCPFKPSVSSKITGAAIIRGERGMKGGSNIPPPIPKTLHMAFTYTPSPNFSFNLTLPFQANYTAIV